MNRTYGLAKKLSLLFDLEGKTDAALSVSMYYINQFVHSEKSSIFIYRPVKQQLAIFSSLDLEKNEFCIPKSCGVAGWVFENRKSAIVNRAYEDNRFHKEIDALTRSQTRNLACVPLIDNQDNCLGTLQALNKKDGGFTDEDLELLDLSACLVAVAIGNRKRYKEVCVKNEARRKFIKKMTTSTYDIFN